MRAIFCKNKNKMGIIVERKKKCILMVPHQINTEPFKAFFLIHRCPVMRKKNLPRNTNFKMECKEGTNFDALTNWPEDNLQDKALTNK